jgi:transcriptional regulator with XRE-family HTH domain
VHEAELAGTEDSEDLDERTIRSRALSMLRGYRGFTQRRLADASGVNKATISSYERGRQEIGAQNLDQILEALGLSVRAWDATLRHVEWLDWLTRRRDLTGDRGPTGREPAAREVDDRRLEDRDVDWRIAHIAEAAGRERERTVEGILDLLLRSLARGERAVESDSDEEISR